MKISTLLTEDLIASQIECTSKKSALEIISHLATKSLGIDSQILFNKLIAREKIGSTGVGNGVAIPHVKIDKSLPATGVFLQCTSPIDFDAQDGNKVDVLFAIFIPEDQCDTYIQALPNISKILLNKAFLKQLRHAKGSEMLLEILSEE